MDIEEQHKLNFAFIKEQNLKVGDYVVELLPGHQYPEKHQIHSIHPDYGWICTRFRQINIEDIIVFEKTL